MDLAISNGTPYVLEINPDYPSVKHIGLDYAYNDFDFWQKMFQGD